MVCAFLDPVGSDISPGSILRFRAFAARRCAERLHLSCVPGRGGPLKGIKDMPHRAMLNYYNDVLSSPN